MLVQHRHQVGALEAQVDVVASEIEMTLQREVLLHLPEDLFLEGFLLIEQLIGELDIAMVAITELEGVGGTGFVILPGTVVGYQSFGCGFFVHD